MSSTSVQTRLSMAEIMGKRVKSALVIGTHKTDSRLHFFVSTDSPQHACICKYACTSVTKRMM